MVRYWHWLTGVLHGDFGNNINGNPVRPDLFERLGVTARMVIAAMLLAIVLAVIVGVVTAVRKNKPVDYVATIISYILIALPVFWFAVLLKTFVAIKVNEWVGPDDPLHARRGVTRHLALRHHRGDLQGPACSTWSCRRSRSPASRTRPGAGSSGRPCST